MTGGAREAAGVIPRSADLIFDRAARLSEQGWVTKVSVDVMEIYNETLRDLLVPTGRALELREAARTGAGAAGVAVVEGLSSATVDSPAAVQSLLARAVSARATGATAMNAASSRSHFIFTLHISSSHAATRQVRPARDREGGTEGGREGGREAAAQDSR
jgi:kinesin family protein C1